MKSKTLSRYASPAEQLQKLQLQQRQRNQLPKRLEPEVPNQPKTRQTQARPRLRAKAHLLAKPLRKLVRTQTPEIAAEAAISTTSVVVAVVTQETVIATVTVIADAVATEAEMTAKKQNQRFPQMMY
jgi:hypothetical protein